MHDAIYTQLLPIVTEKLKLERERVSPTLSWKSDIDVDSLDLVELLIAIESEFQIEIPDEDAEHLGTMRDLAEYIDRTREDQSMRAKRGSGLGLRPSA
jgi:acyl carrier protein